jgi:transcriptional regulator with XRE-family HTH domain
MVAEITVGMNIKRERAYAGKTQAQLAEALGVTPQAVSGWERDESRPDINQLRPLADFLSVTVDEILGGETKAKQRRKTMAISDILYETAEEIREYMREQPETYETIKARLQRLLGTMDRIRAELDTNAELKG